MLYLYSGTLFVSAALLFWIQPLFSKMALPLLGGTPGVWNACMVFYQAALLLGYATAHVSIRWLGVRRQAAVHLLILGVGFFFLPVALSASPPPVERPVFWLLGQLLFCIGWPFWAVASTAPMLQRWFSHIQHTDASDPYFLYSASNLGSMAALAAFPVLIEPVLGLSRQAWVWSAGYGFLFLLTFLCAAILWRSPIVDPPGNETQLDGSEPSITPSVRMHWFFRALVPSSLLLGVTTYLTTDVAAVPLLWVIPLMVYLLTFILVFARKIRIRHAAMVRIQPFLLGPPVVLFFWGSRVPLAVTFPIVLGAFFVQAMVCHGELARRRPGTTHLTEFYLWLAGGGVAGGLLSALLAPLVFAAPLEYPLALAAAVLLRPRSVSAETHANRYAAGLLVGLGILLAGPMTGNADIAYQLGVLGLLVISALLAAYLIVWINRPLILGTAFALLIAAGLTINDAFRMVLHRERSFFGPLLVRMDPQERFYLFYHGTTLHGAQSRTPEERLRPLAYFTPEGPFGEIMATLHDLSPTPRRMAVTGLGVGTIASYGRMGDAIDYYEIDPNVERIARYERYFTFLRDTSATVTVTLGDARLTLARAPDGTYDLIIMDAFSSGSIPMHLLTREAFAMVRSKLRPGGILIYQISNRYLNLEPALAALASEVEWTAQVKRNLDITPAEKQKMVYPSIWVVMSPPCELLQNLAGKGWQPLIPSPGFAAWTDDFSNILRAIRPPKWD